jgi:hypothetical protein
MHLSREVNSGGIRQPNIKNDHRWECCRNEMQSLCGSSYLPDHTDAGVVG